MALDWSLFGVLTVMCGGLLGSLHALVGRMDTLRVELRGEMRDLRTEMAGRIDRLDGRMEGLATEVRLAHSEVDRRLRGGGL